MNSVRKHPILVALILLCVVRIVVLITSAFVSGESASSVALTIMLHLGFSLVLGCGFLLLWVLVWFSFLRATVTLIALVLLSLSLFLSLSDPILNAIIGERLTPSTLSHFAGFGLFLSDYFWKPVFRYWYAVFPGVALLTLYVLWTLAMFWRVGRKPHLTPLGWKKPAAGAVIGAGLSLAATSASPMVLYPVEIDYVSQVAGYDGTRLGMSEQEAVLRIRDFVGLPPGASWIDDRYPLAYRWNNPPPPPADKPDIFIFVVESMRGASLKPTHPAGQKLVSVPAIEQLAAEGVVFQRFLSNGFPSGPGFVGITSGAWMHADKRLDSSFSSTGFDRLGLRLRSNGYRTGVITYDVRYDDKTTWVYNVFEDVIDCTALGLRGDDDDTVNEFKKWVSAEDAVPAPRPLFGVLLTEEPHLPYNWKDADGNWTSGKSLADNYARSILAVDAELGRAFAFLKERARWKNTVVIIIGDHANYLDQSVSSGLPLDDTVFTGGIVAGGHPAIGQPRVNREPASQADIATTVLALSGDWRPAMTLGRNLLADGSGRPPRAVSVRSGGARLDFGGKSIVIPKNAPGAATVTEFDTGAQAAPVPAPEPWQLAEAVRIWSWLIEQDRVWHPSLMDLEPPKN